MAAEATSRFAHLLQPLRDLSKVWKIEIADELEKYTEEVAQLIVTNPEDGLTQLNFAEAALLIQGSTAIYSRKVELLYQLVFQALDLLAVEKGKTDSSQQPKKGKASLQAGLWSSIADTEELLTIDHLIKEGRNIDLDQSAPEQRQAPQRRVPLFLMARDSAEKRKREFRISSCTVHQTGVYLLQESDSKLLDSLLSDGELRSDGAPLVPAPPREVQALDERLQELLKGVPEDAAPLHETFEEPVREVRAERFDMQASPMGSLFGECFAPEFPSAPSTASRLVPLPASDPWALLDEHASIGTDVPLQVGRTSKRLNAKKLLINAEGLPDLGNLSSTVEEDVATSSSSAWSLAPLMAAGNPVESLFLAVAGHLKSGSRCETQRANFGPAWLEFEDLFAAAVGKRRQQKVRSAGIVGTAVAALEGTQTPAFDPADVSDDEGIMAVTPLRAPGTPQFNDALTPLPAEFEQDLRHQEHRKEVAALENMIQDAQQKYEMTIRQHLQVMQKGALDFDNRKFPQLYANVRHWQEQLEPVLKDFESRPDFNIESYSSKFLTKMSSLKKSETESVPFSRLVHGQPRWEVCRRFLTCLLLTNQGNTDILEGEDENDFHVKLIQAERKSVSLHPERDVSPAPIAAEESWSGRRARRKAAADTESATIAAEVAAKRLRKVR